jgi:hypothetical protein
LEFLVIQAVTGSIARTQRAIAPVGDIVTGMSSRKQASRAYRHRAANAQPGGSDARLGGVPGMVSSLVPRIPPCTVEDSSPSV